MLNHFLNLLYPNVCSLCGNQLHENEEVFCFSCEILLPFTNYWRHPKNPVFQNLASRAGVEFASSYLFFQKGNQVQNLLHQLKYRGEKKVGAVLGEMFGSVLVATNKRLKWHGIVPIPLHPARQLERGFNQCDEIAKGLSGALGIPIYYSSIERSRNTKTQTGKHRDERWENVSDLFTLSNPKLLQNKSILIVDDVFTTGATLESCCMAIKTANPLSISAITLAYADY